MNSINLFVTLSLFSALLSLFYNSKYLLSILLALEMCLLNLLVLNIFHSLPMNNTSSLMLSLFILSAGAIEASIGISLLTLITRNTNTNSFASFNGLKV
uniref:NADH-ubiquinone oxidoreductase chain 4L n=1 Tax=Ophiomusa kimblae TaxID=3135533 RepID=A0AAU6PWZ5_9ECHI